MRHLITSAITACALSTYSRKASSASHPAKEVSHGFSQTSLALLGIAGPYAQQLMEERGVDQCLQQARISHSLELRVVAGGVVVDRPRTVLIVVSGVISVIAVGTPGVNLQDHAVGTLLMRSPPTLFFKDGGD